MILALQSTIFGLFGLSAPYYSTPKFTKVLWRDCLCYGHRVSGASYLYLASILNRCKGATNGQKSAGPREMPLSDMPSKNGCSFVGGSLGHMVEFENSA